MLLIGTETDRRHELEEIVEDFPKINDQKQLLLLSDIKKLKLDGKEQNKP